MKDNQHTYTDHLESLSSLPPYKAEPLTCDNCDQQVTERQVVEVHGPRETYEMRVCESCAEPVFLKVEQMSDGFWIYYVAGIGKSYRVVESVGFTIQEAIENFTENWIDVMKRDLVKYKWR